MKSHEKSSSASIYIWTGVLILALSSFVFVTFLTNKKSKHVRESIESLNWESDHYMKLDTCISLLYTAENNNRLYIITQDSAFLKLYNQDLGRVRRIFENFEQRGDTEHHVTSHLLARKTSKTEDFIRLRMLVDSLLLFSGQEIIERNAVAPVRTKPVKAIVKTTAKTDTVSTVSKKAKKKFFKRVFDAIANKEDSFQVRGSRSTIREDSIHLAPAAEEKQLVNSYEKFKQARLEMNAAERELLELNASIFRNLQSSLQSLKSEEADKLRDLRSDMIHNASDKFEEVHDLSFGIIAIVLLLTVIIVSNLARLYRKEKMILEYSRVVSENTARKGELVAQLVHEIRTPLNSIIGFSQLVDLSQSAHIVQENIDGIKSSSGILLTLVNEILDFSKFESGRIQLENSRFSPEEPLRDAVNMLQVLASQKNVKVELSIADEPLPALIGDAFRIKQVMINLLTNAIKFTPENGVVKVSASFERNKEDRGKFKFTVLDSGVGISENDLGRIFEEYVQVGAADDASRKFGTGLGLAICKRIVDLYKGTIKVHSVVGKGSAFRVSIPLPVAPPELADAPAPALEALEGNELSGKHILVADDTRMNLIVLSRLLDKYGSTYDLASDGAVAFELFEKNDYDLLITDIHMPVLSGLELTAKIRAYHNLSKSRIPILGFTGSSSEESKVQYTSVGMNEILGKPFEERDFVAVAGRLLVGLDERV